MFISDGLFNAHMGVNVEVMEILILACAFPKAVCVHSEVTLFQELNYVVHL